MGSSRAAGQDVESGGRGSGLDEIEPVPSLDEITTESASNHNVSITSNMEETSQLGNNPSGNNNVSNRITALIYMWQQHVLSQTNNPQARLPSAESKPGTEVAPSSHAITYTV